MRLESHYDYFRENGWYDHLGTLYNLGVHTVDQVISLFGCPDWTHLDVRSIHHPGQGDDCYDLEFHYGKLKVSVNTSMCVMIDYPRFTLHGTKGSFTLPPVIHNSGQKKAPGRHRVQREMAPESRWGTLRCQAENGCIKEFPLAAPIMSGYTTVWQRQSVQEEKKVFRTGRFWKSWGFWSRPRR